MKSIGFIFNTARKMLSLLGSFDLGSVVSDAVTKPGNSSILGSSDAAANWESLANRFESNLAQQTAALKSLQTKVGFLVVAAVLLLQSLLTFRFTTTVLLYLAVVSLLLSLAFALWAMFAAKAPTPLDPHETMLYLTDHPTISKKDFSQWQAKRFAAASKTQLGLHRQTDNKVRLSAVLLLAGALTMVLSKLLA